MEVDDDEEEKEEEEKEEAGLLSPLVKELWSADVVTNHTLVQVPLDVNATYLNLTDAFGVNGSIWTAAHDNENLIRFASVYETEMVLLLVFGRDRDANPITTSAQISVGGEDAEGNPIHLELSIVRGKDQIEASSSPAQVGYATEIFGGVSTFQNTSIPPHRIRLPLDFWQATFRIVIVSNNEDSGHATTTTEDNEEVFSDLSLEDKRTAVADRLSRQVSLVEVFLPFNVTGKQLGDGDLLNLGWHMDLRLHNDEKDIDWSSHDVCQLQVPMKKPLVPPTAFTVVVSDESRKRSAVGDSRQGSSVGKTQTEDDGVPVIGVSIAETNNEETLVKGNVEKYSEHTEDKREEDAGAGVFEPDSETAKCRLNEENTGVFVTVRVLTNHAHNVFSAGTGRGLDGDDVETDTPQTAEKSSTSASNDAAASIKTNGDMLMKQRGTSPQVTDGQICFYDTNRDDPSRNRYCFALAMGHYHSEEVTLVHKPTLWALLHTPKPQAIYTPYMGDNPALIELSDRCIDTTRRLVGIRSRICYFNEVPVPRPPVMDEARVDSQRQQEEDPVAARNRLHLHQSRRLACEAQKRRLAQHKEREQEEGKAQASGDILGRLSHAIRNMKLAFNFGHVVPTNDSLDHIEYENVCEDLPVSADKKKPEVTLENAQAHLSKDTFGDSLRYVNKLYNRVFGKPKTPDRRRVPSHMPFLLRKSIIREIKDYWAKEVQDTSAHRFRHPQDMQFSFSYFHYLINRAKIHPHTLEEIWREYLDANQNGILDENEVLTAASLAHGDAPSEDFVTEVRECMKSEKHVKVREVPTAEGTLRLTETLTPYITLENLERCPKIRDALVENVRYESEVELMSEKEVTFHMLSDNYNFAWKQMMGTRARRTKFVCINDDMKFPSSAVSQILHELFLSIWPKRSQFELPYHLKNRYAHIDEYNAAQERRQIAVWIALMIPLLVAFVFRAELRAMLAFQDIARARAESASQLAQGFQQAQEKDK
ncbi:unnamed protein product [Peronospora farinosa]|uniref:EF-hand domain-containing protein n=3 Tax=Peronospora farinosa TaxID=134698 RepID=A0AAV0U8V3_9STRA|nr:unnamed protein product [Peronospora farinosa]CAI5732793.1 unnamed protein product [Peronospora farinosa]